MIDDDDAAAWGLLLEGSMGSLRLKKELMVACEEVHDFGGSFRGMLAVTAFPHFLSFVPALSLAPDGQRERVTVRSVWEVIIIDYLYVPVLGISSIADPTHATAFFDFPFGHAHDAR